MNGGRWVFFYKLEVNCWTLQCYFCFKKNPSFDRVSFSQLPSGFSRLTQSLSKVWILSHSRISLRVAQQRHKLAPITSPVRGRLQISCWGSTCCCTSPICKLTTSQPTWGPADLVLALARARSFGDFRRASILGACAKSNLYNSGISPPAAGILPSVYAQPCWPECARSRFSPSPLSGSRVSEIWSASKIRALASLLLGKKLPNFPLKFWNFLSENFREHFSRLKVFKGKIARELAVIVPSD